MSFTRPGGSFAPPLDITKLEEYKVLADTADPQIKEAMTTLIVMLEKFWETPESVEPGVPHPSGRGTIIPLEKAEVERMWDYVPWKEELDMMGGIFDKIDTGTLRNAAFHLLWYGRELCLDREPITNDRL